MPVKRGEACLIIICNCILICKVLCIVWYNISNTFIKLNEQMAIKNERGPCV